MKFTRNVKAISKLLLILLLLMATIVGAILSYLWVIGYFINLGIAVPEKTTVSIANVTFFPQDTSYFNVTLLNPSYSPTDANITQIAASFRDGFLYNVPPNKTYPQLPYRLSKGEEETFKCVWNWANYTGETVKIVAFVADGSGPTFETETPLVDLKITYLSFNSAISVDHFNVTVQNSASSATYVNITEVTIEREPIPAERLSISIPYTLDLDGSVSFRCTWDWSNYQGKNVTVAVYTLQGYVAYRTRLTPKPVNLTITNVLFNVTDTTRFNVTVLNSEDSPTYVNITRLTVTVENRLVQEWTVENGTEVEPNLPYPLISSSLQMFSCPWNWTEHRDKKVTITVYTLQGFTTQYSQITPAPIILEITEIDFNPLNTASFNVTVKNSEFSIADANITEITVILEDETSKKINVTDPTLPKVLNRTQSIPFNCTWSWAEYSGKNVTVVVQTQEGYSANSSFLLKALTIADVLFNPVDTTHFIVTVQNPTELNFTITTISAKIKDGPLVNITDVEPGLSFLLPPSTNITFMCSCEDWTGYQGKDVMITIETSEGYTTSRVYKIPS